MRIFKTSLDLKVPAELMDIMHYYEVYCMMACCGVNAVDLAPGYVVHGMMDHGLEWAERGLATLDDLILLVEAHDGPVKSDQDGFGEHWDSATAAAVFLRRLRETLIQGIEHVKRHGLTAMPASEPACPST